MEPNLLVTKVRPPHPPHYVAHRAQVVEALERDIPAYKITLLSAPAGYGKTTLLAQVARASRLQTAWLSLAEDNIDLERFFRYLLMAWAEVRPAVTTTCAVIN